jgi:hypothetical protein
LDGWAGGHQRHTTAERFHRRGVIRVDDAYTYSYGHGNINRDVYSDCDSNRDVDTNTDGTTNTYAKDRPEPKESTHARTTAIAFIGLQRLGRRASPGEARSRKATEGIAGSDLPTLRLRHDRLIELRLKILYSQLTTLTFSAGAARTMRRVRRTGARRNERTDAAATLMRSVPRKPLSERTVLYVTHV